MQNAADANGDLYKQLDFMENWSLSKLLSIRAIDLK